MNTSWLRCPKTSCDDYGKRLTFEAGAHETHGDLTVEHRCLSCGYAEYGPRNPTVASKTSATVRRHLTPLRELINRQRLEGVEIPLVYEREPS